MTDQDKTKSADTPNIDKNSAPATVKQPAGEIGGTKGQEPTTFGDWQHAGRCSDF